MTKPVRTSLTHPLRVDWLEPPSRVGMTLLPGVRDRSTEGFRWERDLDADLAALQALGATALVCLMEEPELGLYGVAELLPKARARGLEVMSLAIRDGRVPHGVAEVDELLAAIEAHEAGGGRPVIHCRGGLGRTGTIAGCYLVRAGRSPAEALAILHRVRSPRCPENHEQEAFIARYATHLGTRPPAPVVVGGRDRVAGDRRSSSTAPPAEAWYATTLGGLRTVEDAATSQGSPRAVAELLGAIEREVAAAPDRCFTFADDGEATLTAAGRSFAAGRFSTPTLGELRARVAARAQGPTGRLVLSALYGAHPLTDIGTLQATAPAGTLFQVASQFNCLESPGAHVVPVRHYLDDSTQGPRASVSAFPGTFLRHYRAPAPDGGRFVQTNARCLDLLANAVGPAIAAVRSGYLQVDQVHDMSALAAALEASFDQVRVGVHAGVEVVFGHDWGGPVAQPPRRIAQVFTSTMALGGYGRDDRSAALATARRQLLRAAYLGTLLAALDLDTDTVVLTMIGGGVFGNPHRAIWDALHWALAEVEPLVRGTKQILVNTRAAIADVDRAQVRARGGVVVDFSGATVELQR